MGLADLFKPKWKHSDVTVRMSAVRKLDASETSILENVIKNDGDDNVRRLALRKIGNAGLLNELASDHLEGALHDLALERASSLWLGTALKDDVDEALTAFKELSDQGAIAEVAKRAPLGDLRDAALEKLVEPRALADVARQAREEDVRLSAVEAVEDQTTLKSLALSAEHREVALAALKKIDDPKHLRAIAKQAKIKIVRSRAEKQRRSLKAAVVKPTPDGPSKQEKREHRLAQLALLCESMEKLTSEDDNASADDEPETTRSRFAALANEVEDDSSELKARFEKACEALEQQREIFQSRIAERAKQREALGQDASAREELCGKVEALAEDAPDEAIEAIRQSWEELGPLPEGHEKDWERRFQKAIEALSRRRRMVEERKAAREELEALVEEASEVVDKPRINDARKAIERLRRRWNKLVGAHGIEEELKGRFETSLERLKTREDEEQAEKQKKKEKNLAQIERLLEQLAKFEETEDLKGAERCLKDARSIFRRPGPLPSKEVFIGLKDKFKAIERKVQSRVDELREAGEWNRLFNVPKQEELCRQAEELAKVEDTKELVAKLRALQAEWKKVGAVPRAKSEELWTRFKAACDAAYGRCEGHFEDLKKERVGNLARKQEICEEAEGIADSTEWNKTTDRLKQLQKDWKTIGPVERKDSDAVWKRFRATCDEFFGRRKEYYKQLDLERAENLKIKLVLCEKAEAIADSTEWHDTAERLKELQDEWRGIGPVPRKHSDSVWRRFRKACDHFFARRDENLDGGRQNNLKRMLEVCEELEALLQKSSDEVGEADETPAETILERWKEWGSIGPIPFDQVETTENRFREVIRSAFESHAEELKGTDLDIDAIQARKKKILSELEKLAKQAKESKERLSPSDDGEGGDIAEMLREAMARNTFKEETDTSEQQRIEDRAVKLLGSWQRLSPLPEAIDSELDVRFGAAFESAVGRTLEEERTRKLERAQRAPRRSSKGRGKPRGKGDSRNNRRGDTKGHSSASPEAARGTPTPKDQDGGATASEAPDEAGEAQTPEKNGAGEVAEAAPQEAIEAQTPEKNGAGEVAEAAPQDSIETETPAESGTGEGAVKALRDSIAAAAPEVSGGWGDAEDDSLESIDAQLSVVSEIGTSSAETPLETVEGQTQEDTDDGGDVAEALQETDTAQTQEVSDEGAVAAEAPLDAEEAEKSEEIDESAVGEESPDKVKEVPSDDTPSRRPPGEDTTQ